MIGRNESEWGQIGAMMMAGTLGWTIDAPADAAYAVLPVGVDIIKPATSHARRLIISYHTEEKSTWKHTIDQCSSTGVSTNLKVKVKVKVEHLL